MSGTRLNAFLARSGVTSRRGADRLIASGSVRVNGRVAPPDGVMVDPARDRVTVDGRAVKPMARPFLSSLTRGPSKDSSHYIQVLAHLLQEQFRGRIDLYLRFFSQKSR